MQIEAWVTFKIAKNTNIIEQKFKFIILQGTKTLTGYSQLNRLERKNIVAMLAYCCHKTMKKTMDHLVLNCIEYLKNI